MRPNEPANVRVYVWKEGTILRGPCSVVGSVMSLTGSLLRQHAGRRNVSNESQRRAPKSGEASYVH